MLRCLGQSFECLTQLVDGMALGWYFTVESSAETPAGGTVCHDW